MSLTRRQIDAVKAIRDFGGVFDPWSSTGKVLWGRFNKRTWRSLEEKGVIEVKRGDIDLNVDAGIVTVKGAITSIYLLEHKVSGV